jgi:hypothetical protein
VKGYEFLHRVKNAKTLVACIKIVTDQDGYDSPDTEMAFIRLNRNDLVKAIEAAIEGAEPEGWGLDECEFNGEWENESGEGMLIVGTERRKKESGEAA